MNRVYLAGPIEGCSPDEAIGWREYVEQGLASWGLVGVSPLRGEPEVSKNSIYGATVKGNKQAYAKSLFGTSQAIGAKNYFDTVNCSFIFVYLPRALNVRRPSYGSVWEMAWASMLNKPIVLVTDDEYLGKHPLVRDNVPFIVETLDDGVEIVGRMLDVYNDKTD